MARILSSRQLLLCRSISGVLGIVDSDGVGRRVPNVVQTGVHDLDVMVMSCLPVLTSVLLSWSDFLAASLDLTKDSEALFGKAVSALETLSALRLLNERKSLGLRFEGFPVGDIERKTMDMHDIATLLVSRTQGCHHDPRSLVMSCPSAQKDCRSKPLRYTGSSEISVV